MTTMRDKEAKRFVTKNQNGVQRVVVEWVTLVTTNPLSGPPSTLKGSRHWTLLDGSGVNYVDDSSFQVVQTDEILRKV
jgi:hypothetical protein